MSPRAQQLLKMEARHRFGSGLCSVCACTLTPTVGRDQPPTMRTKAHNRSRGRRTPGAFLYWIHLCKQCNAEQARRSFEQWAADLHAARDPRAQRVGEIAALFRIFDP